MVMNNVVSIGKAVSKNAKLKQKVDLLIQVYYIHSLEKLNFMLHELRWILSAKVTMKVHALSNFQDVIEASRTSECILGAHLGD